MPGVTRILQDSAGGALVGVLASTVWVNGMNITVVGDPVAGHGPAPHSAPVMAAGSGTVFAHNIPVCRDGDTATCGHVATGSSNVFAGG